MITSALNTLASCSVQPVEQRLLALLLAIHADEDDHVVREPLHEFLYLSGLDQAEFTAALSGLIEAGVVSIVRKSPLRLRVEPYAPVSLDAWPCEGEGPITTHDRQQQSPSIEDVRRVIAAARIPTPDDAPLYWCRAGHTADLEALCERTGMDVDALCERLEAAPTAGPIRRLTHLAEKLGRAKDTTRRNAS